MLEAIRIRKAGYAIRIEFEQVFKRYKPIMFAFYKGDMKQALANPKSSCQAILEVLTQKIEDMKLAC